MAKIRTVEKEATIIAEQRGLFLWRREREPGKPVDKTGTQCARCGENFAIDGTHACRVSGPVSQPCRRKGTS
jgi:hypothetical protein